MLFQHKVLFIIDRRGDFEVFIPSLFIHTWTERRCCVSVCRHGEAKYLRVSTWTAGVLCLWSSLIRGLQEPRPQLPLFPAPYHVIEIK